MSSLLCSVILTGVFECVFACVFYFRETFCLISIHFRQGNSGRGDQVALFDGVPEEVFESTF